MGKAKAQRPEIGGSKRNIDAGFMLDEVVAEVVDAGNVFQTGYKAAPVGKLPVEVEPEIKAGKVLRIRCGVGVVLIPVTDTGAAFQFKALALDEAVGQARRGSGPELDALERIPLQLLADKPAHSLGEKVRVADPADLLVVGFDPLRLLVRVMAVELQAVAGAFKGRFEIEGTTEFFRIAVASGDIRAHGETPFAPHLLHGRLARHHLRVALARRPGRFHRIETGPGHPGGRGDLEAPFALRFHRTDEDFAPFCAQADRFPGGEIRHLFHGNLQRPREGGLEIGHAFVDFHEIPLQSRTIRQFKRRRLRIPEHPRQRGEASQHPFSNHELSVGKRLKYYRVALFARLLFLLLQGKSSGISIRKRYDLHFMNSFSFVGLTLVVARQG